MSIIFEGPRSGGDFEGAFDHILVAQSIDLFLVAPATADCIARLAAGIADDFLTTFHLAVTAPVVIAPAMNTRMWEHASVQANLRTLDAAAASTSSIRKSARWRAGHTARDGWRRSRRSSNT